MSRLSNRADKIAQRLMQGRNPKPAVEKEPPVKIDFYQRLANARNEVKDRRPFTGSGANL